KRRFLMASLAVAALGFTTLISGILPPTQAGFFLFAICCFLMGGSGTFLNVPTMSYIQETIAPEMMGKVFSLMMTAMTLSMPVGLLFAGPACEIIGVDKWFFWSGAALMATAVLCRLMTKPYDAQTMLPDAKASIEVNNKE
ncbi:MFS transporter, partial [Tyzzerella sp. OttesenSCG-928-J15]|nr:MFS transporter [Tyzzerella sp. OttesenSCG-928-J15]